MNDLRAQEQPPSFRFFYAALAGVLGAAIATAFFACGIVIAQRCPRQLDQYLLMAAVIGAVALYSSSFPFVSSLLTKKSLKGAFRAMALGGTLGGGIIVLVPLSLAFVFHWMRWDFGIVKSIVIYWLAASAFIGSITGVIERDFLKALSGFAGGLVGGALAGAVCYMGHFFHANEVTPVFGLFSISAIPTAIAIAARRRKESKTKDQ